MKRYIYLSIIVCGLILAYFFLMRKDRKIDKNIENPILQENQKEKIILDNVHNKVYTITKQGTKTQYLNPRGDNAIIEENNGVVTINQREWGTEHLPIFGVSYSVVPRLDVGLGVFYYHQWDLLIGISNPINKLDVVGFGAVSYNFRRNYLLYVGYQTDQKIKAGIGIRW